MESIETGLCENCKKQVPVANFQMHVIHCRRNIQLCPLCGEGVSRKEEKSHFEEYHEEIDCEQCGQKITRMEEGNHLEKKCGKRLIPCQFCEISLPRERMEEHEEFCGSRTELCQKCSCYVLIRDIQSHEKSCDGVSTLPCEFCDVMLPYDRLDAHQRQCLDEREGLQGGVPLLVEGDDGLFHEIGAATSTTANNREGTQTGSEKRNFSRSVSHETSADIGENEDIVALPCEICGELCPSDRLMEHQEECGHESESNLDHEFSTFGKQEPNESHFRFMGMQTNREPSRMEGGNPFHSFITESSMHDMLGNLFQQGVFGGLEERMRTFAIMSRDLWPSTH